MSDYIPLIEICGWYSYDLIKRKRTCDKGHRASAKCRSNQKNCSDYQATRIATNYNKLRTELLKNPKIRREYAALKPKYDKVKQRLEE